MKVPASDYGLDKILHLLEYGPFGLLIARALRSYLPAWSLAAIGTLTVAVALAHGIGDEYHQSFVPGRESDLFDAMADLGGGALGGWFFLKMVPKIRKKRKKQ